MVDLSELPLASQLSPECEWRSRLGKDGPIMVTPQLPHTAIDTSDARPLAVPCRHFLGGGTAGR